MTIDWLLLFDAVFIMASENRDCYDVPLTASGSTLLAIRIERRHETADACTVDMLVVLSSDREGQLRLSIGKAAHPHQP